MGRNVLKISKIKYYSEKKNISLRSIARDLEMTPTGFNLGVSRETLRANVLHEVLQILDINYYDLVENTDNTDTAQESKTNYSTSVKKVLADLLDERQKIQSEIDSILVRELG